MPAKSQDQRAFLNRKFGHKWVKKHHFDNPGELPEEVKSPHDRVRDEVKKAMKSK